MSEQAAKIIKKMSEEGYRLTNSRKAIVATLVASEGHITADDLALRVREQSPKVGRMTVYRTLELLCELGMVRPIYQGARAAHYILMTGGSHHHLICNSCHTVTEFETCVAEELSEQLSKQFSFQVSSHLLELHGLCTNCHDST